MYNIMQLKMFENKWGRDSKLLWVYLNVEMIKIQLK